MYAYQRSPQSVPEPAINLSITHGVRASLTLQRTGDLAQALRAASPDVSPELAFADVAGHGYSVLRADAAALTVEFVCLPRPIERSEGTDGGPLTYRVTYQTRLWRSGEAPRLTRVRLDGAVPLGSVNSTFGSPR